MPPKKKDLLKPKPKPKGKLKSKDQEPQSENDFLDAADEHEQAAGKWRAGDAAKATRFFQRAIDMYNEGLKRYPRSFDLAYNKANLEYNITEDERIVSHLGNRLSLLEETLNSHRYAISLNPSNTDVLFNAAQVLTSIAEAQLVSGTQQATRQEARALLEEACEIFTRCLDTQQHEYAQMQAEIAKAQASGEYQEAWEGERQQSEAAQEEDMETASSSSERAGDWATVEAPLTPESILETCAAQLSALTTLLALYDPNMDLSSIEKKVQDGLDTATTKIPALLELLDKSPQTKPTDEPKALPTLSIGSTRAPEEEATTPRDDALLAAVVFQANIAEVTYRSGRSTSTTYAQTIEQLFRSVTNGAPAHPSPDLAASNTHSAFADALMDLASALSDRAASAPDLSTDTDIQWTALTQAQTTLAQLASAPYGSVLAPSRLADIFLARGDADLFRFRLSLLPAAKQAWVKSRPVLVANAGVFYRGARTYAERCGAGEVRDVADAKAVVAEVLKEGAGGSAGAAKQHWKGKGERVGRVLEQMVEEGVVGRENVEGVLELTQ